VNIDEINTVRVGRYNAICFYNGQLRFPHLLNSWRSCSRPGQEIESEYVTCYGSETKIAAFNGMHKLHRSTMSYSKNIQDRSLTLY
jgi:hypothetical protein